MRPFNRFSEVLEESLDVNGGHRQFLDIKNLKLLKNWCARVKNCKFTEGNSVCANLLKRKVQ